MLTSLSLRDVVLIEKLDLQLGTGLTVLTGETGAGKSILLDGLGLALGGRAEAGLVRAGAEQAVATACFAPPAGHPVAALLAEHGLDAGDDLVLRRIVGKDGRSRALINDQPVGVALLRRVGGMLVEVQGQHDQQGLADASTHRAVLDGFGVPSATLMATESAWTLWRSADTALNAARSAIEAAERDQEWLQHQVDELDLLAPEPGEEETLAAERQQLQQNERRAEAVAGAMTELAPRDRRSGGPAAALRAASRALERLVPARTPDAVNPAQAALAALERAEDAVAEAEGLLNALSHEIGENPRQLERLEERLFALRAAARKHGVPVSGLAALRDGLRQRLAAISTGAAEILMLTRVAEAARKTYAAAAASLAELRRKAASRLDTALNRELAPLKLDRARFLTDIMASEESGWGPHGTESVRFLIATNPGQPPGPLIRVASGGELSRLMLALKVVIASNAPLPTLIFDEVDAGVGGATAASVGERLARLAEAVQVLVVTHSPQVAARGLSHLQVAKSVRAGRTTTAITALDGAARREEIARMLAGETITDAARSAADSLLARA